MVNTMETKNIIADDVRKSFYDTKFTTDDGGLQSFYADDNKIDVSDVLEANAMSAAEDPENSVDDAANRIYDELKIENKTPKEIAEELVKAFHLAAGSETPLLKAVEYIAEHYDDRDEFIYPKDVPEALLRAGVESAE